MRRKNDRVFLEVQIGNRRLGRIVIELFNDIVPRAAENFRDLCTGVRGLGIETGLPLCYVGCKIFEILPGQFMRCGDFEHNNGHGGESVYGGGFEDENFNLWHGCAGIVSMHNTGSNANRSQFYITFKQMPLLNRKNVIVGQVRRGMEVVRAIEKLPTTDKGVPRLPALIVGSGLCTQAKPSDDTIVDDQIPLAHQSEVKVTAAEKGSQLLEKLLRSDASEPYNASTVKLYPSGQWGHKKSAAVRAQEQFNEEQLILSARRVRDEQDNLDQMKKFHGLDFTIWNEDSVFRKYDKHVSKYSRTGVNNLMITKRKKDKGRSFRSNNQIEDVTYINYRNKLFNKKLEKAYGAYVVDIRQNLERGTAI